jgi:hypothetical protein
LDKAGVDTAIQSNEGEKMDKKEFKKLVKEALKEAGVSEKPNGIPTTLTTCPTIALPTSRLADRKTTRAKRFLVVFGTCPTRMLRAIWTPTMSETLWRGWIRLRFLLKQRKRP